MQASQPGALPQDYPYNQCRVGDPQPCALGETYGQQTVVPHGDIVTAYRTDQVEPGGLCSSIGFTGNTAELRCENGSFQPFSSWVVDAEDYPFPICTERAFRDCSFQGQTISHGSSITTYNTPFPSVGQQCLSQQRVCTDGTLLGSYQYIECNETPALCGNATALTYDTTPAYNLCAEGYLIGSVGINITNNTRERTCG